jgi:hypothetical protein
MTSDRDDDDFIKDSHWLGPCSDFRKRRTSWDCGPFRQPWYRTKDGVEPKHEFNTEPQYRPSIPIINYWSTPNFNPNMKRSHRLIIALAALSLLLAMAGWFARTPLQAKINKRQAIMAFKDCNSAFLDRAARIVSSLQSFYDSFGYFPSSIEEWHLKDGTVDELLLPLDNQVRLIEIWLELLQMDGGPYILVPDPGCKLPPPFSNSVDRRAVRTDLEYDYYDPATYRELAARTLRARTHVQSLLGSDN